MELAIPAIKGIGGSLLYLVDRYGDKGSIWDIDFRWTGERDPKPEGVGLHYIDHLTHNVYRGRMDHWAGCYARLFNFRQIRYFNIEGKLTGLHLARDDVAVRQDPYSHQRVTRRQGADRGIPQEVPRRGYPARRHGRARHLRVGRSACRHGMKFMPDPPTTYYEKIDARLPGHGEDIDALRQAGILIDGEGVVDGARTKVLLQIFSETVMGPIFFEFIQRKGDEGFGEGNFRALFESIEEDQIRRGVLQDRPHA